MASMASAVNRTMSKQNSPVNSPSVTVGDWMPRITLPSASGGLFDSSDPMTAGQARVYWLGAPLVDEMALASRLEGCETELHVVSQSAPQVPADHPSWVLDHAGELGRAFAATGPLAIIVDATGRVAAVLPAPTPDGVADFATELYRMSAPTVVKAKAPVLLLERVMEPAFCQMLMEYWRRGNQVANRVGSATGNVVNDDVKRRIDVQVDDPSLFVEVRDCLVRRVVPAILQAFHTRINVIEAPIIGCYDADAGGKFRRHRDDTSSHNAHRQFALSLNLNADDEYDGGEVRFAEFGRELYRPVAGGALVFSGSLLHEVMPVTRGRRFGLFTFLSTSGPAVGSTPRYTATPRQKR
jgi:predicted 2-oxoglutarate/Fe(II)-dependent dioxygenase YbiX